MVKRIIKLSFNFLVTIAIIIFFLRLILGIDFTQDNKSWSAQVIKVADGDTITVNYNGKTEKIRLLGVNSPETAKDNVDGQCYGDIASDFTHKTLDGQSVVIIDDSSKEDFDKYGRRLAYIEFKGQDYNKTLLDNGLAKEFTFHGQFYQRQRVYKDAENKAKVNKVGLWRDCS